MSDRELAALFHALGKDMDARQSARIKQLQGVERKLFEGLVKVLVEALDKGDGKITDRRGSVSIGRLVDQIFRAIERNDLKDFYKSALRDLGAIISNGAMYAKEVKPMKPSGFQQVSRLVNRKMRRRLGIDPDTGKINPDGYLYRLFKTEALRRQIGQTVARAVGTGRPMTEVMDKLEAFVVSNRKTNGALVQYFRKFIVDEYQRFDRDLNNEYAKRLQLDDFIYQGGLIETSRQFCIDKDGKVFSREEASKWEELHGPRGDKTLPMSTKERTSGVLIDYEPIEDMGRDNCRHRPRFISPELAEDRKANAKR